MNSTTKRPLATRPFDAAAYLKTPVQMAGYLEAALDDGDPVVIATALGDIARAKGMSSIAEHTGLSRESLYKALGPKANPQLTTFLKVLAALGLQLHATPRRPTRKPR